MTTREQYNQMIAALEAAREGRALEYKAKGDSAWSKSWTNHLAWDFSAFDYRPAPEPKPPRWVAWTFETCPVGMVIDSIVAKHQPMITSKETDGLILGMNQWSYVNVFTHFKQLDGSPCGTLVKEEGE